jgi:KDO2-lipid IV(A) lauroyltransferase
LADRVRALRKAAEGVGFRLLVGLVRALPPGAAAGLARGLGRAAFDVVRIRRTVAVENVERRLGPAGGRKEAERIARRSYEVMARTFLDLVRFDRIDDGTLWRLISREEFEVFGALRDADGGVLVSGHFGNWELLVLGIRRMGVTVSAIAADQTNARVNAFIRESRARAGVPTLSSRHGIRGALAALRRGEHVATLMDQDARGRGVFVDFLGAPASCHTGVVSMAVRTGRPVVPGVLVDEGARYRLVLGRTWRPDPARSAEDNLRDGAVQFHRFLEEQVRAHPENYFWAHRRWKTRPPERGA